MVQWIKQKRHGHFRNKQSEINGDKVASDIERYCYQALLNAGIEFKFQPRYIINPGFDFMGHRVRPLSVKPDFEVVIGDTKHIIDTKGMKIRRDGGKKVKESGKRIKNGTEEAWILPDSHIKYKLLKYKFWSENQPAIVYFPYKKEIIDKLISDLKAQIENERNGISTEVTGGQSGDICKP